MKLSAMTAREQMLVVITAAVVVGGGYGLLRYRPALQALHEMQKQTAQTEQRLKTLTIPDEPVEDGEVLNRRLAEAERDVNAVRARAAELERRLPPAGAQEVKLKISELAQLYGLRIRQNEPYKLPPMAAPSLPVSSTPLAGGAGSTATAASVSFPVADLPARFTSAEINRPLQQISMEGPYDAVRNFVDALGKLPWQVTVAGLQMEVDERTPPPGMPQPLRIKMILAL